jgi:uncharacterized membrane protein (UPF0136 family)
MTWLPGVLVTLSLIVVGGGVQAYVNRGSIMSLAPAIVFGLLLLGSAALAKTHPRPAYATASVVCLFLLAFFIYRFMETRAIWPAAVVAAASGITLLLLIFGHFAGRGGQTQ